jgi:hypothetical protein
MVRTTHQAVAYLDLLVNQDVLLPREAFVLRARGGILTGTPLTYAEVATALAEQEGSSISRQRCEAILKRALRILSAEQRAKLIGLIPFLGESHIPHVVAEQRLHMQNRRAIRRVVRAWPQSKPLQYAKILELAGVSIPPVRHRIASTMGEEATAQALLLQYGITTFGHRAKICSRCHHVKLGGEFSVTPEGRLSSVCKECKNEWAKGYYQKLTRVTNDVPTLVSVDRAEQDPQGLAASGIPD